MSIKQALHKRQTSNTSDDASSDLSVMSSHSLQEQDDPLSQPQQHHYSTSSESNSDTTMKCSLGKTQLLNSNPYSSSNNSYTTQSTTSITTKTPKAYTCSPGWKWILLLLLLFLMVWSLVTVNLFSTVAHKNHEQLSVILNPEANTDVMSEFKKLLPEEMRDFANVPIKEVERYWDNRPCNLRHSKVLITTRNKKAKVGTKDYFQEVELRKYKVEPHIPRFADFPRWKGKRVLEIGCGLGTESVNFARSGAILTIIELSGRSLELTKQRFSLFGLTATFHHGNAEEMDRFLAPDAEFDLIWSFGVIHHTPHPEKVIQLMRRYVEPTQGEIRIMVYSKVSYKLFFLMKETDDWDFAKADHIIAKYSEAQTGSPVTHSYTFSQIRKMMANAQFDVVELTKDHIFPWKIDKYVNYEYELEDCWKNVTSEDFREFERELGWHTLVVARPAKPPPKSQQRQQLFLPPHLMEEEDVDSRLLLLQHTRGKEEGDNTSPHSAFEKHTGAPSKWSSSMENERKQARLEDRDQKFDEETDDVLWRARVRGSTRGEEADNKARSNRTEKKKVQNVLKERHHTQLEVTNVNTRPQAEKDQDSLSTSLLEEESGSNDRKAEKRKRKEERLQKQMMKANSQQQLDEEPSDQPMSMSDETRQEKHAVRYQLEGYSAQKYDDEQQESARLSAITSEEEQHWMSVIDQKRERALRKKQEKAQRRHQALLHKGY